MRSIWSLLQWVGGLALLIVFALVLVIVFRSANGLRQPLVAAVPSATVCAPTPVLSITSSAPPTATPQRGVYATAVVGPTITPWPISKTTDLAPTVASDDKATFIVFHCDGTFEEFLVVSAKDVPTRPGDVIMFSAPPRSGIGHSVPAGTVVLTLEPTVLAPELTKTPATPELVTSTPAPATPYP